MRIVTIRLDDEADTLVMQRVKRKADMNIHTSISNEIRLIIKESVQA